MSFIIVKKFNYSTNLVFKGEKINCLVGRNGIGIKKREGDFITPKGIFSLNKIFYRHDRIGYLKSSLQIVKIAKNMGWSNDSKDKNYNTLIKKPYRYSHEDLYRESSSYNILITVGYNKLNIPYKGSGIFIHCTNSKKKFTEGCIAIEERKLRKILRLITPRTKLLIC